MTMQRVLVNWLLVLVSGLVMAQAAQAHRFAPSLLKVTQIGAGQYAMVWKTPAKAASNIPMRPLWPESCEVANASPPQLEGTGKVSSWQLHCSGLGDDGLVGETLGIEGLGANQSSAMVMVELLDGRHYQQVLNADQPDVSRFPIDHDVTPALMRGGSKAERCMPLKARICRSR